MNEEKYNKDLEEYKNTNYFFHKYWFIQNNLFKSYNTNQELTEYIINDLEILFAIYTLNCPYKYYNIENWQDEKSIKERWFQFIKDYTEDKYSEDIIKDFSEKVTKKIISLTKEELKNIKVKSDNIIKKNYQELKIDKNCHLFYKGFFYNKDISIEYKRMLYDDILKSKYFGFSFVSSIKQNPKMLTFPKIFYLLSKEDLVEILHSFDEFKENKKVDLLNLIKEIFIISTLEDKKIIKKKLLSIKNETFSYLFDELEKEENYREIEINKEDYKTTEQKLGEYIKNNTFFSIELIELMTNYVEYLNEKYKLKLKINPYLKIDGKSLGYFEEKTNSISINFESLSNYQPHSLAVIEMINVIHHELIHAIQFNHEFKQKNDYETLIQIIDSYTFHNDSTDYNMNYWNISFEYDARARAYIETQRFVYNNCPELKKVLLYLEKDDLDQIRKRIRKTNSWQNNNPGFFLPAIFSITRYNLEDTLDLNKYPVLNKIFYLDKKNQKIKMYGELHFRNKLLQAKLTSDKEMENFYKNILIDFEINKYLKKHPFLSENELNSLDKFKKGVK